MDRSQISQLPESSLTDACTSMENSEKGVEPGELGDIAKEMNEMYAERLETLDNLDNSSNLRAKLLLLWVSDLVEQNEWLVETVEELERAAVDSVTLLEDKLRKSSITLQKYMNKAQETDEQTPVSVLSLVSRLEADIGSLLLLIRRAMTEGYWDMRGLVFHEVSYWDIFHSSPPPSVASVEKQPTEQLKMDTTELEKLKEQVEFWRLRAERSGVEVNVRVDSGQCKEPIEKCNQASQQLRSESPRLCCDRDKQIEALTQKLQDAEQRSREVQAVLAAEVAEKHDQVVQLRQRVQQLEGECRLANMQTQYRDEVIKGMRKEVKRFKSQLAVQCPSLTTNDSSSGSCVPCKRSATMEALHARLEDAWACPTRDVNTNGLLGAPKESESRSKDTSARMSCNTVLDNVNN